MYGYIWNYISPLIPLVEKPQLENAVRKSDKTWQMRRLLTASGRLEFLSQAGSLHHFTIPGFLNFCTRLCLRGPEALSGLSWFQNPDVS